MKIWQIVLVSSALGFTLPAVAQMAAKAELRSDVAAKVRERLGKFDTNGDGVVTRDEMMAYTDRMMKTRADNEFSAMDTNHDGSISRAEFDDFHAKQHGGMRADGRDDERIVRVERHRMMPPPPPPGHDDVPPPPPGADGPHGGHARMMLMERHGDDMMMAEGRDRLVIDDAVKAALARFDAMDTDHDGKLTPEERQALRTARGGMSGL